MGRRRVRGKTQKSCLIGRRIKGNEFSLIEAEDKLQITAALEIGLE